MNELRLDPNKLPKQENLIFEPLFRGGRGTTEISLTRNDSILELRASAELGIFLFGQAISYEIKSQWSEGGHFLSYTELNKKNNMVKKSVEALKSEEEPTLDPLGALYALRMKPIRETGELRRVKIVRPREIVSAEFMGGRVGQKLVTALGTGERSIISLDIFIKKADDTEGKRVLGGGRAQIWVDVDTNVPVEMSYELQPFGKLSLGLVRIER